MDTENNPVSQPVSSGGQAPGQPAPVPAAPTPEEQAQTPPASGQGPKLKIAGVGKIVLLLVVAVIAGTMGYVFGGKNTAAPVAEKVKVSPTPINSLKQEFGISGSITTSSIPYDLIAISVGVLGETGGEEDRSTHWIRNALKDTRYAYSFDHLKPGAVYALYMAICKNNFDGTQVCDTVKNMKVTTCPGTIPTPSSASPFGSSTSPVDALRPLCVMSQGGEANFYIGGLAPTIEPSPTPTVSVTPPAVPTATSSL